jgi:methyl-accepting chemotaxis protein
LQRVATIDMSENITARERLEVLLAALSRRNVNLSAVVSDAVRESQIISDDVDGMVTGIQFQDRTRQRLEHVVDTLHVIDKALEEVKHNTVQAAPEIQGAVTADLEWVKKLLDRFTMSDVRARFVAQLIEGKQPDELPEIAMPSSSGSIELF